MRSQDYGRRKHLLIARQLFSDQAAVYDLKLTTTALCHFSYFDLGPRFRSQLGPFTAQAHRMYAEVLNRKNIVGVSSNARASEISNNGHARKASNGGGAIDGLRLFSKDFDEADRSLFTNVQKIASPTPAAESSHRIRSRSSNKIVPVSLLPTGSEATARKMPMFALYTAQMHKAESAPAQHTRKKNLTDLL